MSTSLQAWLLCCNPILQPCTASLKGQLEQEGFPRTLSTVQEGSLQCHCRDKAGADAISKHSVHIYTLMQGTETHLFADCHNHFSG